jgi:ADP-heptose:LPS heptosyltransferase
MNSAKRPAITQLCERLLLRFLVRKTLTDEVASLRTVPGRILAVKVHGMGDSVLVRSLLEHFHRRHPQVQIGVLAGPANRDVLSLESSFNVHQYDQHSTNIVTALRTLIEIRKPHYQAVINFEQGSLAGTAFVRCAGIPVHVGLVSREQSAKATLLTHALHFRDEDSMWASFIRLMRIIDRDFPEPISTIPLPIDEHIRREIREWLSAQTGGSMERVVAFHLGSAQTRPYRRWPVERFIALAERLRLGSPNLLLVLTGQAFERPLLQEFTAGYSGRVADATGLGSIARVAALLAESHLLVSNDTGIMHLGAAMGTPTVGIFGPASPRRWGPVGPYTAAVSATGVICSPCAETYLLCDPEDCANPDRMRCLNEVTVDMAFEAAARVTRMVQQHSNRPMQALN